MKEAYVKFETAKLLKEKGFDWECDSWAAEYITGVELHTGMERRNYNDDSVSLYDGLFSAPTQQMACRWLREEHNILVCILPCEVGAGVMDYTYCIYRIICDDFYFKPLAQGRIEEAMDYEKTLEAGLEYALTNLI